MEQVVVHCIIDSILAGLLVSSAASAQPPPPPPLPGARAVAPSEWLKRPGVDDFLAVFPEQARRQGISGRATLRCEVSARGTMQACIVVEETPAGFGYGAAALRLAPKFIMSPPMQDGRPVPGFLVRIPIVFNVPGPAPSRRAPRPFRVPAWTGDKLSDGGPAVRAPAAPEPEPGAGAGQVGGARAG